MRLVKVVAMSPQGVPVQIGVARSGGELHVHRFAHDALFVDIGDSSLPPYDPVEGRDPKDFPRLVAQIPSSWALVYEWSDEAQKPLNFGKVASLT